MSLFLSIIFFFMIPAAFFDAEEHLRFSALENALITGPRLDHPEIWVMANETQSKVIITLNERKIEAELFPPGLELEVDEEAQTIVHTTTDTDGKIVIDEKATAQLYAKILPAVRRLLDPIGSAFPELFEAAGNNRALQVPTELMRLTFSQLSIDAWSRVITDCDKPDVLRWLFQQFEKERPIQIALGENPKTPSEILLELSQDDFTPPEFYHESPRREVARNRNTPAEILVTLSADQDPAVVANVASNPSTPVEILKKLSTHEYNGVRQGVARNENTPVEILGQLVKDTNGHTFWSLSLNPALPTDVLVSLACSVKDKYDSGHTLENIAHHPNTPPELAKELLDSEAVKKVQYDRAHPGSCEV